MNPADIDAILLAEDRRREAVVAVDLAALDALFANDLVHIHSNAVTHDKASLLAYIAERRAFVRIDRGQLAVRVIGDAAVITGAMTNHMRVNDEAVTLQGMVTQVLRREEMGWRFVSFQLTLEK